jgi:hypothetical protein
VLIAIGLAVALVAGTAAYASVSYWYGWSTTQPEAVLPSTINVFVRMDFSPGLGQRIKLGNLARKFPSTTDKDSVDQLKRDLVNDLGLDPLDYDSGVKPWLGDRVGLGSWPTTGAAGRCDVAALASRDDTLATAALTTVRQKKGSGFGFALSHGFAVYARCANQNSQSAVEAVLAQAKTRTLADRPDFSGDLSALPSGQAAVGWAALPEGLGGLSDLGDLGGLNGTGLHGTVLLGAQATDGGIDVRYRAHLGGTATHPARDVVSALGALPGGTVIGVSADLSGLPTATIPGTATSAGLVDLLPDLLGGTVSLSMSDVRTSSGALRLVIQAADATRAGRIASALTGTFGGRYSALSVNRSGTTVTASSASYRPGSGSLNDSSSFRSALGAAPHDSLVAAYVDVTAVSGQSQLAPDEAARLAPITAAGFSSGYDGDTLVGHLRILVP